MKHKGVLLDIDNTLYNYERSHKKAIQAVFDFAEEVMNVDRFEDAYARARKNIHLELAETASSHNRLLYFQKTCEYLKINPLIWAMKLYNIYWDTFLDSIELYEEVEEFLKIVSAEAEICFVTDLTAHIQYRKIEKLGLANYVSHIVSSEEAGREKPSAYMFLSALHKLKMSPSEVCMIGDSYQKDILGASSLGIRSIWLNQENKQEFFDNSLVTEVKAFKEILGHL
jgi:putative hydrolase of the HAD superfamily